MPRALVMLCPILLVCCRGGKTDCRTKLANAAVVMATALEEHPRSHPAERAMRFGIAAHHVGGLGDLREPPRLASSAAPAALELRGPYVAAFPMGAVLFDSGDESARLRPRAAWPLAQDREDVPLASPDDVAVRVIASDLEALLATSPHPELIVAVDREAPWRLVARIGRGAASAGYVRLQFLFEKSDAVRIRDGISRPELTEKLAEGGGLEQIGTDIADVVTKSCSGAGIELDRLEDEPMKTIVRALPSCRCNTDLAPLKLGVAVSFSRAEPLGDLIVRLTGEEVAAALGIERLRIAPGTPWSEAAPKLTAASARGPVSFGRLVEEELIFPAPPPLPKRKPRTEP